MRDQRNIREHEEGEKEQSDVNLEGKKRRM